MKGGPSIAGGFNVATGQGGLTAIDPATEVFLEELTHTTPKFFQNDSVVWEFRYTAPAHSGQDTIYSVGNSTDFNLDPTGDSYNFGDDFVVNVHADTVTAVGDAPAPLDFRLSRNYPNPFNPTTTISFSIGKTSDVSLAVYDIAGRKVATLVRDRLPAGLHAVTWEARDAATGVYIYVLETAGRALSRRMLLLR